MHSSFLALLVIVTGILAINAQEFTVSFDLERIQRATVYIIQAQSIRNNIITTCVGSGTIVRFDGLILTNAHNTVPNDRCPGDILIVAMSLQLDEPPVPRFRVEIAQMNAGLDLALLRITRELDGRIIGEGELPPLPFVELADSNQLQLDETITVVGYPGIGNETVNVVRGTATGFIATPSGGEKSWIKTNAIIPGTMSGGGVYNRVGQLVGIPTTAPTDPDSESLNCQPVEDTNDDGLINNIDRCIALGSQINTLRPSLFARPLIRSASLNLTVQTFLESANRVQQVNRPCPTEGSSQVARPRFCRLFFSPSVSNGLPTSVVGSMPANTSNLFLFFDYENMTPETVYEVKVTIDGIPNQTFSLSPVRWSGSQSGLWYIGAVNQPWPNGIYEFRLFIDDVPAGTARINMNGVAEPIPTFSNIVFGVEDTLGNTLVSNGFVLPSSSIARARFIHQNIPQNIPWTVIWYLNGREITRSDSAWDREASGSADTALQLEGELIPGNYRVDLYIEGRLSATSDFVISGAAPDRFTPFTRIFSNSRLTTANDPESASTTPAINSFPDGVDTLFAVFDWENLASGTLWTMRWSVDDESFFEETLPWSLQESGQNFVASLTAPAGVPDGTYQFELFINGVQMVSETSQVGIGQLPIERLARAEGIQLRGRIIDGDTEQGIEGATFILISRDFAVEEFTWDAEQIFSLATTDRNGDFQIDRPLQFGDPYSVLISVDGYLPITADGFIITNEDDNPLTLTIPLTSD